MIKKIEKWIMVLVLAVAMAGVSCADEVKGRDVVDAGTIQTLSGTLKPDGGHDWFLITKEGTYELHLGPGRFRAAQGFKMSEGDEAETTGFVHEDHMAPITLTVKGTTVALRTDEGRPLWAGTEFGGKDREEGDERTDRPDRPDRPDRGERRGQGAGRSRE